MLLLTLLFACDALNEAVAPTPERAALPAVLETEAVWKAVVTKAPQALPRRFTAGLPLTPGALDQSPDGWPPLMQIQHDLCYDRHGVREAVVERLGWGAQQSWQRVLPSCQRIDYCDWLIHLATAPNAPHDPHRAAWWGVLDCDVPNAHAALASDAPPDIVVIYAALRGHPIPVQRIRGIVQRSWRHNTGSDTFRFGLHALAMNEASEAGDALLALHADAPPGFQIDIARAMWGRSRSALRVLHEAACADHPIDPCGRTRYATDPLEDLDGAVRSWLHDPRELVERYPLHRNALSLALVGCVREEESGLARRCLVALMDAAPERARTLAELHRDREGLGDVCEDILRGAEGARTQLEALGLGPDEDRGGIELGHEPRNALEWLLVWGHARRLSRDDRSSSADWAALEMAHLAGLEDVYVQAIYSDYVQVAPERTPRTTLYAWSEGTRYRTLVEDSYNGGLDHVVGLINVLLEDRQRQIRVGLLDDGLGTVAAIAASPQTLAALRDDKLVPWAVPYQPEPEVGINDTGLGNAWDD